MREMHRAKATALFAKNQARDRAAAKAEEKMVKEKESAQKRRLAKANRLKALRLAGETGDAAGGIVNDDDTNMPTTARFHRRDS